ncbi:MAG: hypothetical protein IPM66_24225 [Acidobacteriota bacterium]|nr:MAG: hypothetical protein IPM66_24225 [Acidobacteriota bacterium]
MSVKKSLSRAFLLIFLVAAVGVCAMADTIKLKDGSVLKGKVVSYREGRFTIIVYIGGSSSQHVIPVDEVESVEFDQVEVQPAATEAVPERTVEAARPAAEPAPVEVPPAVERPAPETDSGMVPVIAEKTVSVAAAADWTSTDIRVQRGQRIVINASGEVDLGDSRRTSPDGVESSDSRKLIPNKPTGALIAVVGDDNDDFIFVGGSSEFISPHNGILFLSVNEGNLRDNNGAFVARVKVLSNR